MDKLYTLTETIIERLKALGADMAYCTASSGETREFNVDGGEFSLFRTLFDNSLTITAFIGGKKGSVGLNSFDEDSRFKSNGGFNKINKVFANKLESIVLELNEYLYDDGGRTA